MDVHQNSVLVVSVCVTVFIWFLNLVKYNRLSLIGPRFLLGS